MNKQQKTNKMEIKEQILSISQILELYKLGFDVADNSNMCWIKHPDTDKIDLTIFNKELYNKKQIECIPTLFIGEIINILPVKIEEDYFLSVNSEHCAYSMVGGIDTIFFTREKELINNLFNTLVWCIKNKHINYIERK